MTLHGISDGIHFKFHHYDYNKVYIFKMIFCHGNLSTLQLQMQPAISKYLNFYFNLDQKFIYSVIQCFIKCIGELNGLVKFEHSKVKRLLTDVACIGKYLIYLKNVKHILNYRTDLRAYMNIFIDLMMCFYNSYFSAS